MLEVAQQMRVEPPRFGVWVCPRARLDRVPGDGG